MGDKMSANMLARLWAEGLIAPEDFDEDLREWKKDRAVEEAVKLGEVHRLQLPDEVRRRQDAGRFGRETPAFVDRYPRKYRKGGG